MARGLENKEELMTEDGFEDAFEVSAFEYHRYSGELLGIFCLWAPDML